MLPGALDELAGVPVADGEAKPATAFMVEVIVLAWRRALTVRAVGVADAAGRAHRPVPYAHVCPPPRPSRSRSVPTVSQHPNRSPPEPSGPRYSARVALSCERGHAPGQVLHALQELRQVIDDRLRRELGGRYDRHSARSVGTDKLTVTFTLRAATDAEAIRSAGLAAGTLAELLTDNAAAVDLSGVALVVRAQERHEPSA